MLFPVCAPRCYFICILQIQSFCTVFLLKENMLHFTLHLIWLMEQTHSPFHASSSTIRLQQSNIEKFNLALLFVTSFSIIAHVQSGIVLHWSFPNKRLRIQVPDYHPAEFYFKYHKIFATARHWTLSWGSLRHSRRIFRLLRTILKLRIKYTYAYKSVPFWFLNKNVVFIVCSTPNIGSPNGD
jgi:hypothetical protein